MEEIEDHTVDMVLCDLPYGITNNSWDKKLNYDELWNAYGRILKTDRSPVVLFGGGLFAHELVMSKPKWFRYEWIWEKPNAVGFLNANRRPLSAHEMILVFAKKSPKYYPVKELGYKPYVRKMHAPSENYNS